MTQTTTKPTQSPSDTAKRIRLVLWILLAAIAAAGLVWFAALTTSRPAPETPQPAANAQLVREDSHRLTAPAAEKAQLVEFLDFECESCRAAHPLVEELKAEYGDRITSVNRYFPLPGHRNSGTAALAVEASAQAPVFRGYAQELGLDLARYDAAVAADSTKDRIRKDAAEGTALVVTGTPTFFLNGKKLVLNTEAEFRQLLTDAAR